VLQLKATSRGGGHARLIDEALAACNGDAEKAFDQLYRSMNKVASFGRMARFDYLTMIAKLGMADIRPPSAYIRESTGPMRGARLLFDGMTDSPTTGGELDKRVGELDQYLRVGPQALEDAICNWQKNPSHYKRFAG
jgi:hypothetical protein